MHLSIHSDAHKPEGGVKRIRKLKVEQLAAEVEAHG